jgi:hypothetical protein
MWFARAVVGVTLVGAVPACSVTVTAASSRQLSVTGTVDLGTYRALTDGGQFGLVVTSAPDGVVYFADGSVVKAVKGDAAPVVVVHTPGPALDLAATASDLYVETGVRITEYGVPRVTVRRSWTLPPGTLLVHPMILPGFFAQPGVLWAWSDPATDESGFEYATVVEISTTTSAERVIDTDAYPGPMAADPDGLYYEVTVETSTSSHGYLVHAMVDGKRVFSRPTNDVPAPLFLGPGYVAVIAEHQPSQSLFLDTFASTTLSKLSSVRLPAGVFGLLNTTSGLLGIEAACDQAVCANAKVVGVDERTGAETDAVDVPYAVALLTGPLPSVITNVHETVDLVRLS